MENAEPEPIPLPKPNPGTTSVKSDRSYICSSASISADMLADEQIYDLSDLTEVVPGFGFGKGIGSGSAFSMRGIGSYGIGAAVVSSLVTNMNGHSVGTGQFLHCVHSY